MNAAGAFTIQPAEFGGDEFCQPSALSKHRRAIIPRKAWALLSLKQELAMKHQTLDQLHAVARVEPSAPLLEMTRNERIARWAELLEQNPERCLGALTGTEHLPLEARAMARGEGSAIAVAFEDATMRASGLRDDTYGEAKRFFELNDWQLHDIVCDCHVGATMKARWAAARVRRTIGGNRFLAWLRQTIMH
jgi:hypothetical protein